MSFYTSRGKLLRIEMKYQFGKSNKFYNLSENDDGTFNIRYGRIGTHGTELNYSCSVAYDKYEEKIKKGYTESSNSYVTGKSIPPDTLKKIVDMYKLSKTYTNFKNTKLKSIYNRAMNGEQLSVEDFGELNRVALLLKM